MIKLERYTQLMKKLRNRLAIGNYFYSNIFKMVKYGVGYDIPQSNQSVVNHDGSRNPLKDLGRPVLYNSKKELVEVFSTEYFLN